MRRCPPFSGGSKLNGSRPSSRSPEIGAGQCSNTQISVMHVPGRIAPGFTLGAALSYSTRERPCASLPVTTRRIGLILSVMLVRLQAETPDDLRHPLDFSAHDGRRLLRWRAED